MSQPLIEMAKELVTAHILMKQLSADDAHALLMRTHATLLSLHQAEASGTAPVAAESSAKVTAEDWKASITKHAIKCLECGGTFKQLSNRHFKRHGLDQHSYRDKYGIPRSQPLSAKVVTVKRRELAQRIRPWELAPTNRARAKAPAKGGRRSSK